MLVKSRVCSVEDHMTKQIDDTIEFEQKSFVICNPGYAQLVEPKDFGMEATRCGTSLIRGCYATYAIENQRLILDNFSISTDDEYFPINGQEPFPDELGRNLYHYQNLQVEVESNGNLLIGYDRTPSTVLEPVSYKIIKGLHFENGHLVAEFDYSRTASWLRLFIFLRKYFLTTNVETEYDIISKYIPLCNYGYDDVIKSVMAKSTMLET